MHCSSSSSKLNRPEYVNETEQTIRFLVVKPSSLPFLIPFGPKYSHPKSNISGGRKYAEQSNKDETTLSLIRTGDIVNSK